MLGTALYQRPEKAKRSAGRRRGQRPRLQSAAAPQDGSTRVSPQRCRRPPPSPRFRPSEASDARRGPGPHLAPHPRPAAGSPRRAAARSPASFVRWALLPGRRRRPARPRPSLRRVRVSARQPAPPQSAGAAAGRRAGFRGRRRERSSALRACAFARPGLLAASVRGPEPADQLSLRLAAEAPRPPQGPTHR